MEAHCLGASDFVRATADEFDDLTPPTGDTMEQRHRPAPTWEQWLKRLRTQVVVVTYQEREGKKDFVACDIVVERDSQKAILIGKGGQALKHLGRAAREEMEAFLGRGVYLQLFVKTRTDWRDKEGHLREYGFGA